MTPADIKAPNQDVAKIVESVRKFIKMCPYLPEYRKHINVNYLGGDVDEFSIETIPSDPIVKRYITGESIRQFQFYFESREQFDKDVINNLQTNGFYELFAGWLEECTKQKVLPDLEGNRKCLSISADTQGYIMDIQNGKASYVIQCTMRYVQLY